MFRKAGLISFIALLAFISYATLVPLQLRPNSGHLHGERMLAFAALGGSLAIAFPGRWRWTLVVGCSLAFGLEALQTLVPTRDGRLPDAIEKSVGAASGVFGAELLTRFLARRKRSGGA